jgi:AraC-like DNA-binding protein
MKAAYEHISTGGQASFAFRTSRVRGFPFNWHFHPEYELTLIPTGRGKRFVGDHIDDYTAGDLILLGPNVPHTWYSPASDAKEHGMQSSVVIQFLHTFMGEGFFERPEMSDILRLLNRSRHGLNFFGPASRSIGKKMMEMKRLKPVARFAVLIEVLQLLSQARSHKILASKQYAPSLRTNEHQRIDKVCAYMNDRYRYPVAVEDAARLACLSPSAFSRLFHRTTGKTFVAYLTELRVAAACQSLCETDHNICDVALDSGFENLSNFNRRFLKAKKMTPREYRRHFLRDSPGS